ncbi:glycosyltransferase family 4 protein [Turicibacter sp. H121]|uniref:glycosyltransferase family 4 protein n=1 Tax=Turicibacter sp. H121 TaxID=1712675 RepID=UPI00076317D1|nr:glycosyltransferase family 4 protein [Turicibacter sp. H121]AMC08079.1 hypothetical protein AT726_03355 [Turicibacter sp. H121]MCU7199853.1 glycosyltransferase family 4 protein [Turicibacter sp. H121]
MKICIVTKSIFNLGGVQRVVSVIANQLSEKHEVHILCTNPKYKIDRDRYGLKESVNIEINKVHTLNESAVFFYRLIRKFNKITGIFNKKCFAGLMLKIYYPQKVRNRFKEYFNEKNFDVIIGAEGENSLLLGVLASELSAKVVGWQHSSTQAYFNTPNRYLYNQDILCEKFLKELDDYVVLTSVDKEQIKKKFSIDAVTIYNPLSFNPRRGSVENNKTLLTVARLDIQTKGLDLLLKAYKEIHTKYPLWNLKIVGDGPDKKKLEYMIEDFGLNNFVQLIPHTDSIIDHYLDASIFISSSRWEGFGLAITEAMACGVPVVAFENTGPKEIINQNGKNGILVPSGNISKLVEAVIGLINSIEQRRSISEEGYKRIEDFNIEEIEKQWIKVLSRG